MNADVQPPTSALRPREGVFLCLALLVTVAALVWVWLTPDQSGWHFWWVAQAMPVAYVLLLWWVHGIRSDEPGQR